MDTDYDIFEVVTIIRSFWLVDAAFKQRIYSTYHGRLLKPGYYVVNWPEYIKIRRFDEYATYHGPFELREEAQLALYRMHKEWRRILNKVYDIPSIPALNSNRIEVKEVISRGLQLTEGIKVKQNVLI